MAFDGIVTYAVTNELQNILINGRVNKIYQPTSTELAITIRNKKENHVLLFSIHPSYARFSLTKDEYRNPDQPPMYCMVLRKYLTGAILESIRQDNFERIVHFEFKTRNEIGDESRQTLVVEIMGRHSNLILLNSDKTKIIDALKHIPAFQNRHRTILPGADYILPPEQNKLNPLEATADDFVKKIDFNQGRIDRQIVNVLSGVSPLLGQQLLSETQLGSQNAFKDTFIRFQNFLKDKAFKPAIYQSQKEDFHVYLMTHLNVNYESFSSVNEMIDNFYSGKAERDRVHQQSKDLARFLKNEIDRNLKKLKIHRKTIEKAKNAEHYQKMGELLTANMHLVKQGDKSVTVIDYYDPEQNKISIPLKTDSTPSENAQRLFTRYRKLNNSKETVTREIHRTIHEINYLRGLAQQIETARESDIDVIREELVEEGYLKKQKRTRKNKAQKPVPEEYKASDGTLILVGRNNKQNDYLTHRVANTEDIWLHTLNIPGSHVVIRNPNPTETTLLEAAELAAYFSQARLSAQVPVDYTKIKYVRKPSGAKPGYVTYDNQKTIYVTPKEDKIQQLKKQK